MVQSGEEWSLEPDYERYQRLLEQVRSGRFWVGSQLGRPTEEQLQQQIERIQRILDQIEEAAQIRKDNQ